MGGSDAKLIEITYMYVVIGSKNKIKFVDRVVVKPSC